MNISGLQIALVGIVLTILRHYRIVLPETEVTAVIAGLFTAGGILWEWYKGFKNGTNTLGGFKKP